MRCRLCGRNLKSEKSIAEGIGPGCKKKCKNDNIQVSTLGDFYDEAKA